LAVEYELVGLDAAAVDGDLVAVGEQVGGDVEGVGIAAGLGLDGAVEGLARGFGFDDDARTAVGVEDPVGLLYTSDAADGLLWVDLGGSRTIKKINTVQLIRP